MIIDLSRFIETERPLWTELEAILNRLAADGALRMDLQQTQRFHYLYQRVLSDLGRIVTFSSEPEIRRYLESLAARAYGEINETRDRSLRFTPFKWFLREFPRTFRRHIAFFWLSTAIMLAGGLFGAGMMIVEPDAKTILIPAMFGHLYQTPTERVEEEESAKTDSLAGNHAEFSAQLMSHNIHVCLTAFALGIIFGLGTMVYLFGNGIILGVVVFDYVQDGQGIFMLGWLLPHGVIEIPSILIAGQAGLLLGRNMLGRGDRHNLIERLRMVRTDLLVLVFGFSVMLLWAGFMESFLSQHHQPVVPYSLKISIGVMELILLIMFLAMGGRKASAPAKP